MCSTARVFADNTTTAWLSVSATTIFSSPGSIAIEAPVSQGRCSNAFSDRGWWRVAEPPAVSRVSRGISPAGGGMIIFRRASATSAQRKERTINDEAMTRYMAG